MIRHILTHPLIVPSRDYQTCPSALLRVQTCKRADRESDVLFALEAVDREDDLAAVLFEELGDGLEAAVGVFGRGIDAGVDDVGGVGDAREGGVEDAFGECRVYDDGVGKACCGGFEPVEGEAVEGFEEGCA